MRFTKKQKLWYSPYWIGRKGGFKFSYTKEQNSNYYVSANSIKKDIRYNSLWEQITFKTETEAQEFCETFDHKEHICLGDDV